uniref:type II toxin-antitoxin system VapC family toxin n=1 Tax=uncultured Caulobacter sp. TaxID=158749 RepID=UPI0025D73E38|nr:type II toxin-antitoxin system VapC family toxin [uncultured Caulobacter sp.]
MFVDASAWTAMLLEEPEAEAFREKIADAIEVTTSAIANWETVRAVARETNRDIEAVSQELRVLQLYARAQILPIGQPEQIVALDAHARFGKGAHPARLNMGDCFAYACATLRNLPLLYKGDDFSRTDITAA